MVSEIIRWQTPPPTRRTATESVEMHGQQIAAGDKVVMWYVSEIVILVIEQATSSGLIGLERDSISRLGMVFTAVWGTASRRCNCVLWEEILKRFEFVEVVATPERSYHVYPWLQTA